VQKLFPPTLNSSAKKVVPIASLIKGECIAIYFSAPVPAGSSRQFTPTLLERYAHCKAANNARRITANKNFTSATRP
jgi:hypothetical protein